jgi:exonuclease III
MNRVSINENPGPWSKDMDNAIKIASLNCAGLKAHFQDIKTDGRLQRADIMHLVEISLTENEDEDAFALDGYNHKFIKNGNGKGIATYYAQDKFHHVEDIKREKFQITKFKHVVLDIINVYRSQSGHSLELLEHLKKQIDTGRITIITGDFNICFMENFNNRMVQGLLTLGFDQLVHEPSHIRGRHIDHTYFLDPSDQLHPIIDRYSPYYSDHDGICITIPEVMPENKAQ